ncbi:Pol, partial [Brachionus plicatilis]
MSLNKTNQYRRLIRRIDVVLNQVENDEITSIYNFSSNKVWIIEFNAVFNVANIFDRDININGTIFKLKDANKVPDLRRYCTFRFHFLSSVCGNHRLETFFNAVRIDGLNIEKNIKILKKNIKIDPRGKIVSEELEYRFQKKLRTLLEAVRPHNNETLCEKCHQKGHLVKKCSIAEKIKSLERKKFDYNDLFIDQEETQSIFEAGQIDNEENGNLENKINKYINELEQSLIKWKIKTSVEKSCSVVFSKNKKESDNLNLKIYGNRIVSQKEIKFLGIKFDSKLNFNILVDEIKERCNNRLNIIKILSNKKWVLNQNTLGNLYKSLQFRIQQSDLFLSLKYDTPSNIVHHEAFNKLKLLTVSNRLFEMSERNVGTGLSHSIPLVVRLVKEYKEGFESRYIEYPTPL